MLVPQSLRYRNIFRESQTNKITVPAIHSQSKSVENYSESEPKPTAHSHVNPPLQPVLNLSTINASTGEQSSETASTTATTSATSIACVASGTLQPNKGVKVVGPTRPAAAPGRTTPRSRCTSKTAPTTSTRRRASSQTWRIMGAALLGKMPMTLLYKTALACPFSRNEIRHRQKLQPCLEGSRNLLGRKVECYFECYPSFLTRELM